MASENRKVKNDFILIGSLLAIALMFFAGRGILTGENAAKAEITVDGEVVGTYSLSEDVDDMLIRTGWNNGTVHVRISDGSVLVTQSTCPDKICVKQGTISKSGQTIVCLPNKLVVTVQ